MSDKNSLSGKGKKANEDIKGINISIDAFGRITRNMQIDKVNTFLNKNLKDKKLTHHPQMSARLEEE